MTTSTDQPAVKSFCPSFNGHRRESDAAVRVRGAIAAIGRPRFTSDEVRAAGGFNASQTQTMFYGLRELMRVGEVVQVRGRRGMHAGVYRLADERDRRTGPTVWRRRTAADRAGEDRPRRRASRARDASWPPPFGTSRPRAASRDAMPINALRIRAVDESPTLTSVFDPTLVIDEPEKVRGGGTGADPEDDA